MAVADAVAPPHLPRRTGLRREIGFIGLLWASGGSIIGSGWLFGAQGALAAAGPAAIISWVIGAVAILLLALVHAELGAMYPVAGGTARFPHYAFGGAVGASFGWFSWLQAATVAPIEVMAVIQYGQHYSFASGWMKLSHGQHVLTASGVVAAVVLMALFTAINFLGVRRLANTNSTATWWKIGVPILAIVVLGVSHFHPGNFTAANGLAPTAPRASWPPSPRAGSSSRCWASSRPTSSRARARTPSATSRAR
jgi:amino acid transporter